MLLNKVELQKLVVRTVNYDTLTKKEAKRMLKALWSKYWGEGLDSFKERVALASYITFPASKEDRDVYIRKNLARLPGLR